MAPDISKINTDRHPDPGTPAWNFRDKVIRRLLHGKQSLPSGAPAHPIFRYLSCIDKRLDDLCHLITLKAGAIQVSRPEIRDHSPIAMAVTTRSAQPRWW